MKKTLVSVVMALVMLCAVTVCAGAADTDSGITVQLDGQNLEFTDAMPQIKDDRTFLPYRAVFEAMGAEVGYDDGVVTAQRGDTELTMTIGETTATVQRGGAIKEVTMDVAPYIDPDVNRTYVPVRFAADAFGCIVGWDQAAQTVILVDVETLVDEAFDGKEFTVLQKYLEYGEKYNAGSWAVEGAMAADGSLADADAVSILTGTVNGIVSGDAAGEMSMTMDMDLTELLGDLAGLLGATEDDLRMSMAVDMKLDLTQGVMYMKMDDALNAEMGLDAGTWMSIDINELLAEYVDGDVDITAMSQQQIDAESAKATLKSALAEINLDDQAAEGYTILSGIVNQVVTTLSDEGFQATDTGFETNLDIDLEGGSVNFAMTLTTGEDGAVTGYGMDVNVTGAIDAQVDGEDGAALGAMTDGQVSVGMSIAMDENDQATATVSMAIPTVLSISMNMDMTYTATDEVPNTALPADAQVVDFLTLMEQMEQAPVEEEPASSDETDPEAAPETEAGAEAETDSEA